MQDFTEGAKVQNFTEGAKSHNGNLFLTKKKKKKQIPKGKPIKSSTTGMGVCGLHRLIVT